MPFSATWLGRSAMSVTVRLGEIVGLGSKVQNASVTLTSGETRFAFRAAATVGGGSAGFDLVYDPTGRIGQATLTASASRVSLADLTTLLGFDLGLRDAVGDIDLRLRGGGRNTRDALNSASGSIEVAVTKGLWPRGQLASWPGETQRLLGGGDTGVPFNCIAGRFDVSGGVASLRRLVVDTPRTTMVGGGYLSLRTEGLEFILAPEARDNQNAGARLAAAGEGRQRPRDGERARAQPRQPDHSGRRRCRAWRPDHPGGKPDRRQSLRPRGAARRRPAARAAGPDAGAVGGRHAHRAGRPQAQTAAPQRQPAPAEPAALVAGPATACKPRAPMKRFYKETAVDLGDGGHRILLDGKPMRTPAKAVLVVPTRALAEAIAAEWREVPDKADINASHLPLTRLAATGLDRVTSQRARVIEDTAKYAGSDMLCYRATAPRAWSSASTRPGSRCSTGRPSDMARGSSSSRA